MKPRIASTVPAPPHALQAGMTFPGGGQRREPREAPPAGQPRRLGLARLQAKEPGR